MTERNYGSRKSKGLMNSRRIFLKSGAAVTGATLLGSILKTEAVSASEQEQTDLAEAQLLFVQNAQNVLLDKEQLQLAGVNPTTIFFSDRPKRIAGHMSTEDFVLDWQERTGMESFHSDPPNATLSVFGEDEIVDLVVELRSPRFSGKALIYDVVVLEGGRQLPSGPASLFIDPIGMPLSATSVAGVHRRHRRRRRRRIRHVVR